MSLENDAFRGLFFAAIGLFILILLLLGYLHGRKRRLMASAKTTATVTFKIQRTKRGVNYRPTYEYYVEGIIHKTVAHFLCSPPFTKGGEQVDLYYIPNQPSKIYVLKEKEYLEKESNVRTVFLIIFSLVFLFSGLAVAFGFIKVP